MHNADRPLTCPKCGSTHFLEAEFKQYYKNTYSATPGGELSAVPKGGPRVRICMCGHPVSIATLSVEKEYRDSFAESEKKAVRHRAALEAPTLKKGILQAYVRRADAQELYRKLSRLLEIVDGTDSKWKGTPPTPQRTKRAPATEARRRSS